jgi:hypothetical protein
LLYWKISENSYVFRGFHIHPLAFKIRNLSGQRLPKIEIGTLDGHYFPRVLKKNNWQDYFVGDLQEICVATWTTKEKSYYFEEEGNFSSRLRSHILNNQVESEIASLERFAVIGGKNAEANKIIEISEINLEKTLTKLKINKVNGNEEELKKEMQFIEGLEKLNIIRLILMAVEIILFKLFIFLLLRPALFTIRKKTILRKFINDFKTRSILKNAIFRFNLIKYFQDIIGFDVLITKNKLELYKEELSFRLQSLNNNKVELKQTREMQNNQNIENYESKSKTNISQIDFGLSHKYLITLQAKSELTRHYKKRLKGNNS